MATFGGAAIVAIAATSCESPTAPHEHFRNADNDFSINGQRLIFKGSAHVDAMPMGGYARLGGCITPLVAGEVPGSLQIVEVWLSRRDDLGWVQYPPTKALQEKRERYQYCAYSDRAPYLPQNTVVSVGVMLVYPVESGSQRSVYLVDDDVVFERSE